MERTRKLRSGVTAPGRRAAEIEANDCGINLDIEGAPEGIHIEYEILPRVLEVIVSQIISREI